MSSDLNQMTHPLDRFALIDKEELETLRRQLKRAIHYCSNAGSVDFNDPHQECTATWPGAAGYARSAMDQTLFTLNLAIDGARLHDEE